MKPSDVVWTFSGVRPLLDDESGNAAAVTRDSQRCKRKLACTLVDRMGRQTHHLPLVVTRSGRQRWGNCWVMSASLGLTMRSCPAATCVAWVGSPVHPVHDINEFAAALRQRCPWVDQNVLHRWAHTYGSRTLTWLEGAKRKVDLGAEVAPGLFERELNYLRRYEWAQTAEDVLWRRTKLGLHYTVEQRAAQWPTG